MKRFRGPQKFHRGDIVKVTTEGVAIIVEADFEELDPPELDEDEEDSEAEYMLTFLDQLDDCSGWYDESQLTLLRKGTGGSLKSNIEAFKNPDLLKDI